VGKEIAAGRTGRPNPREIDRVCGLIGYSGTRPAQEILLAGLERLEYRGYDSAGICLGDSFGLSYARAVGNLAHLKASVNGSHSTATSGVGHTRWATHGRVSIANAHPLAGCDRKEIAVVLNGIVENFFELRQRLALSGHLIHSETDAETVAHLVEEHYQGDLVEAVGSAYNEIEGHFAFVVIHRDQPGLLVGARLRCPLVVGLGEDETFIASMSSAFAGETRRVKFVEDGDVVAISPAGARFFAGGEEVQRRVFETDSELETAEHEGHESFMLKEIHEQPEAVGRTLAGRIRAGRVNLEEAGLDDAEIRTLRRIAIVACGTAYHAGLVGRYAIEGWARIPVEADIASEWRYRDPLVDRDTLVIGISQSGETADTIAALRLARERGARTLAVTNMTGSQITREADNVINTRAGLEMGVAATKTFTAQASLMYLLALYLAEKRGTLAAGNIAELLDELQSLPAKIAAILATEHPTSDIARRFHAEPFFLYLGRHVGLPICLEGALKLKEISYIPTDAYSAGEMKHGPIALLGDTTPVVCIATDGHVYDKVVSNIQEVRARGAQVIAVASDGNEAIQHLADEVIYVPRAHPFMQALLAVVPLQLLAYRIAQLRGLNVDQPRNLAKTVTVE
jgi:glutamine---fructose-6-phosphate transaminase (isomerizing)